MKTPRHPREKELLRKEALSFLLAFVSACGILTIILLLLLKNL